MSVFQGTGANFNLLDIAQSFDQNGMPFKVANMLSLMNPLMTDGFFMPTNQTTSHKYAVQTALPSSIIRKYYQGVPTSKGAQRVLTETCISIEARSAIDRQLVMDNGNSETWRLMQNKGFLERISQDFMRYAFYGDTSVETNEFNGFATRYGALSSTAGTPGYENIIDAKGTGSNLTSIWLVCHGPQHAYFIYPKNTQAGINHRDLGELDNYDSNNDPYRVLADEYIMKTGLVIEDWRYVVRIPNIDMDAIRSGQNAPDLLGLMTEALYRIPSLGIVQTGQSMQTVAGVNPLLQPNRPVFYCTRGVAAYLDKLSQTKSVYTLVAGNDILGRPITTLRGYPVKVCDGISRSETKVV